MASKIRTTTSEILNSSYSPRFLPENRHANRREHSGVGQPGYVPQVVWAINIIVQTDSDKLLKVHESTARLGGAIAFKKTN